MKTIKKFLVSLLPLLAILGCFQTSKEYTEDDLNFNEETETYSVKFSDEIPNGDFFQIFGDKKIFMGKIKNGKKDGLWTEWHKNGQKPVERPYKHV